MHMMNKKTIAKRIYTYLNEVYFDGVLPLPINFYFVEVDDFIAGVDEQGAMYFNTGFYFQYDHVEIMLHEMCHIWQLVIGAKDIHGRSFKEIALDISQRSGYNIQEFQNYFEVQNEIAFR
jgi:hypothetical protein